MSRSSIVINGKSFTHDQIITNSFDAATAFERTTLSFCHQWLSGREHFTLQTSGSTGAPKEITFSREQMIASAKMTQAALHLKAGDNALICLDTKYIAGQMMLVRSFVIGMNILAMEPSANPLVKIKEEQQIDFTALVPYQLQNILSNNQLQLNNIRVAIIGGAPVDPSLQKQLQEITCNVYATYGMTETLSHVGLMKLNGPALENEFTTLPGVAIEKDDRGCLVINTDFLKEPVVTNDLVEITKPDQFKWFGRWDNVINTGGVKVIPEKIETQLNALLKTYGIMGRYFVFGLPDTQLGQKVCLAIENTPLKTDILQGLQTEMKSTLSKYEVPKEIKFLERFEETETGKVNRLKTINLFPA